MWFTILFFRVKKKRRWIWDWWWWWCSWSCLLSWPTQQRAIIGSAQAASAGMTKSKSLSQRFPCLRLPKDKLPILWCVRWVTVVTIACEAIKKGRWCASLTRVEEISRRASTPLSSLSYDTQLTVDPLWQWWSGIWCFFSSPSVCKLEEFVGMINHIDHRIPVTKVRHLHASIPSCF